MDPADALWPDGRLASALALARALDAPVVDRGEVDSLVAEAVIRYPRHPVVMTAAARLLRRDGRADLAAILLRRLDADGGDSRVSAELAALHEDGCDLPAALGWYRKAVAQEPFDVALQLRTARLEFATGQGERGLAILAALDGVDPKDPALDALWAELLWRHGDAAGSVAKFERAYARGLRDPGFLMQFADILSGEMLYDRVLELEPLGPPGSSPELYGRRLQAHAQLALRLDRPAVLETARRREEGARWLSPEGVVGRIDAAIRGRRPLSMLRLGDGEARFLIWSTPALHGALTAEQLHTVGGIVWDNWFGEDICAVADDHIALLRERLVAAIATADLLGVSSYVRLRQDTGHFGFLGVQETLVGEITAGRDDIAFFDALANPALERVSPSLSQTLTGLDFLGLISPHADLEGRLLHHLRPAVMKSYVVPGEARLDSHAQAAARQRHFPDLYRELMQSIEVPFPGAVYLVGAGLLGKIYCMRIKQLGGVAIDVGSLVDGWMGVETRPNLLANVEPLS